MSASLLCRVCLEETDHLLGVYSEIGNQLKIADIVSQHFWFDIKENDEISNKVCTLCWSKIEDFHDFYLNIQRAQDTITIIESKFVLDEKSNLKEIFIGDTIFKVDGQLQFDDNNTFKIDGCQFRERNLQQEQNITDLEIGAIEQHSTNISDTGLQIVSRDDDDNDIENATEFITSQVIQAKEEEEQQQSQTVDTIIHKDSFLKDSESNEITSISQKQNIENDTQEISVENSSTKGETNIRQRSSSREKESENYLSGECGDLSSDSDDYVSKKTNKKTSPATKRCRRSRRAGKKEAVDVADKENQGKIIESYYKMACEICHEHVECFEALFEHYMKSHGIRGFITCCGKKYFKRAVIAEHVLWHKQPDLFKCKVCNKLYAGKRCLNNHLLTHAPPDMKLFKCDHCPKSFVKKFKLERHKLSHLAPEEKKYLCDECEKPYASHALLRAHKRVVHEKTYAHMCEICARVFKSRVFFEKHQLEHLGQNLPRVQCQICEAWMKNEHTMRAHMRLHQDAGIIHECDVCGKQGPSRNAILKHKRFVHLSERKFKCTLCDKAFKRAITLKEHMSVHTGEILYTCTFCPKTFNSGANMHAHRKRAHPIEWEEEKRNKIESMKPSNTSIETL